MFSFSVSGVCPNNFFYVGSLDTCYHISSTIRNISEAKAACRVFHNNARLVAIDTYAKFDFFRRQYERLSISQSKNQA